MTTLETRIARAREVGAKAVAVEIDVLAAKDAEIARLIAARDGVMSTLQGAFVDIAAARDGRDKAEAEVARLRGLLREARHFLWDVPGITVCARIDAALATEDTP